jgi:AcrR family transcriptional regulator
MSSPVSRGKKPDGSRRKPAPAGGPEAPESTSRGERRRRETRERLLRAAFRLFAERGVDAVPINEITEAADVGFGSFYNHFPSKEAIHDQLMQRLFEEFADDLDRQTANVEDPAEVLAASIRHAVLRAQREPLWGQLLIRETCGGRGIMEGLGTRLMRDLRRGIDAGRFTAPDLLLSFIMLGTAILGAVAAKVQLTAEETAALERLGISADGLPERTAAALLHMLGLPLSEARAIAKRPLPNRAAPPGAPG